MLILFYSLILLIFNHPNPFSSINLLISTFLFQAYTINSKFI